MVAVCGKDGDAPAGHPSVELAVAGESEPFSDGEAAAILHTRAEQDAARPERSLSPPDEGLRSASVT